MVSPVPPLPTARVPEMVESVEVATQLGMPPADARMVPAVPKVSLLNVLAPEA